MLESGPCSGGTICFHTTSLKRRNVVISGLRMVKVESLSSRLICGRVDTVGDVDDFSSLVERLLRSSNRGSMTTFGSPGTGMASINESLPKLLANEAAIEGRRNGTTPSFLESESSGEYSARCWKDSGFTITLKVPGSEASALRSRSSSVNKVAKGARSSMVEPALEGADEAIPTRIR